MARLRYRLSRAADDDLSRLYDRGIDVFGLAAADRYDGLVSRLSDLAENPRRWQAVDHVRIGYRRCVYQAHSIYYRINVDELLIVRILNRENPATSLPD